MNWPGDLIKWNIFKIMTACCQITCTIPWLPCEQLPYPPDHPRISRIWQRDKSELPLFTLPYKYFLPWYSSFTTSSKPFFPAPTSFQQGSSPAILQIFDLLPLQEDMAINFTVPEVNSILSSFLLSYFYLLQIYLLSTFFLSFSLFCSSKLQTFRNWQIKLWFPPINPTFNVSGHWVTWTLPIWSTQRQIESPLEIKISL